MEHIGVITEKLIKDWQGKTRTQKKEVLGDSLKKLLSKKEQKHIMHWSLRDSRLILSVDSSTWLYILNLKKEQLLKGLNQILSPQEAITEIFLQLGNPSKK